MKKTIVALAAATGLLLTASGCNDSQPAEQPQPLQCVEADGEPCDDDPLDLDDLLKHPKTPSTTKQPTKPVMPPVVTVPKPKTPITRRR